MLPRTWGKCLTVCVPKGQFCLLTLMGLGFCYFGGLFFLKNSQKKKALQMTSALGCLQHR